MSEVNSLSPVANEKTRPAGFFYGYVIVIASLLIAVMMFGSRLSFGIFFAPVLDEFGWSRAVTSGGFSLSWVGTGLLSIFVGRLNDRIGPRWVLTLAGCLLGLGYLLMSRLNAVWQLYLFYAIVSVGMSGALVPLLSTVARWFIKMRASMTGIVIAGTGIALMVLVPAANYSVAAYGWHESYVILGAACLVVIVVAAQFLRRDPYQVGKLPYGYDAARQTSPDPARYGLSFKEACRTNQVWLLALVYFCSYFLYYIFIVHMVIYATGEGIPQSRAVLIISVLGAAGIGGRVLMGIFADRIGDKPAMVFSASLMVFALLWLLVAKDLWTLYVFGLIYGFGHGGLATMESPIVARIYGMRSHGAILGLVFFGDTCGGALGPVVAGYIFDITQNYYPAFQLGAGIGVVSLIAVLLLRPLKGHASWGQFER